MLKRRKFSIDIPRLKAAISRADLKADHSAPKDPLPVQLDSPPPTPKSVRPPLPQHIESELRLACAHVLENWKPSGQVYEEQDGLVHEAEEHQAAAKSSAPKGWDTEAAQLAKLTARAQAAEEAEDYDVNKYRYRPDIATEDLFKHEDEEADNAHPRHVLHAEQIMAANAPRAELVAVRPRTSQTLLTMVSSQPSSQSRALQEQPEPPIARARTDSVDTTSSTPRTDSPEYVWSGKASTAMTSAVPTPARSQRTSSQALHLSSEGGSMPRVESEEAYWMKEKLSHFRKAEEARQRAANVQKEPALRVEPVERIPGREPIPRVTKIPARKPVPASRSASRQETRSQQVDDRQSEDRFNSISQSNGAPGLDRHASTKERGSANNQDEKSHRAPGRKRSFSQELQKFFRPSSGQQTHQEDQHAHTASRTRSMTRQLQEYVRPRVVSDARKVSVDSSRPLSKSKSIHSVRSAVSDAEPVDATSRHRWRSWKADSRHGGKEGGVGNSRRSSELSKVPDTGSAGVSPIQQESKAWVNLNRELPPLPGLDQWKPVEPEKSKQSLLPTTRTRAQTEPGESVTRGQSRQDRPALTVDCSVGDSGDPVTAQITSPEPSKSRRPTIGGRMLSAKKSFTRLKSPRPVAAPVPAIPISDLPPVLPAITTGPLSSYDFGFLNYEPLSLQDFTLPTEAKPERNRSRSVPLPSGPAGQRPVLVEQTAERPVVSRKAVNYSRVSPNSSSGSAAHSRTTSEQQAQHTRTLSMEDYNRRHDTQYRCMAEISIAAPSLPHPPPVPALPVKEKTKRKWWQGKEKKMVTEPGIERQAAHARADSGTGSGFEVAAGSPVVRF